MIGVIKIPVANAMMDGRKIFTTLVIIIIAYFTLILRIFKYLTKCILYDILSKEFKLEPKHQAMKNLALFKEFAFACTAAFVLAIIMFAVRIYIYSDESALEIVSGDGGLLLFITIISGLASAIFWRMVSLEKKKILQSIHAN